MDNNDAAAVAAATIWGPHYWFFLHSVARTYPAFPNEVTRRKYYDLFSNLPLFIPDDKMGNDFAALLDEFPVSPYLKNRSSLTKWVFHIHNKYNSLLQKPTWDFQSAEDAFQKQFDRENIALRDCIHGLPHSPHAVELSWNHWWAKNKLIAILAFLAAAAGIGIVVSSASSMLPTLLRPSPPVYILFDDRGTSAFFSGAWEKLTSAVRYIADSVDTAISTATKTIWRR